MYNTTNPTNPISPANQLIQHTILLTIDVEDWFQVENLRLWYPPTTWDNQKFRVEQNTHRLLDLLDSIILSNNTINPANSTNPRKPKATFFILGWIAQRCPRMVVEIANRGHEIASHGFNHLMCNRLDSKELRQDLIRSKKTIEDITGVKVQGYRAPSFSINDTALKLIQESGYCYDSSYNNFSRHGRYGTISLDLHKKTGVAFKISQNFMELPISNLTIGNQTIPWGGGGYFRFLPLPIFKVGVKRILKKTNAFIFYLHPWEIDPHQPRVKQSKGLSSWRHYLNLDKTHSRLYNLISTFKHCKFTTCSQYLDDVNKSTAFDHHARTDF